MSNRWLTEDLWHSIAMAERDVRAAYAIHGLERPGPQQDDGGWDERPDWLAPFVCPCGGVWHVRRHYDDHECESRERESMNSAGHVDVPARVPVVSRS